MTTFGAPTAQASTWQVGLRLAGRSLELERVLFVATVLAAVGIMWLAPRLPLTDLPQHAAQVALWRDVILGRSAWTEIVRTNLFTPYLIGYGLTLPFALLFSLSVAVRIVLAIALIGFVAGCIALRRAFGGDPRLDWLFPVGFFGFAWQWGFLTFLVASPIALLFLLVVNKAAVTPTMKASALVIATGVLLLFSHGLLFIACLPIGGLLALVASRRRGLAGISRAMAPFLILGFVCIAFRLLSARAEGAMRFDGILFGGDLWLKPMAMMVYVTNTDLTAARISLPLTAILMFMPFALRCTINKGLAPTLFVGLVIVIAAMPSYAFQTALLFHRFALFLLPFYALLFRPPAPEVPRAPSWTMVVPMVACWLSFGLQAERIRAFASEARPFEAVLAAAEPNRRALSLVFDRTSSAARNDTAYLHFPLWYQAEKGGFVDFNFAEFHPQVVRFKSGRSPDFTEELGWHPERFDGAPSHVAFFNYIFVRGTQADVDHLVAISRCPLEAMAVDLPWTLLQVGTCPVLRPAL